MISEELEISIQNAFEMAKLKKHEFLTLEHLMLELCKDEEVKSLFSFYKVNYNKIERDDLSVYMVKDGKMCWNTPPTCVRNENFIMKKKYNYKFYYDDQ